MKRPVLATLIAGSLVAPAAYAEHQANACRRTSINAALACQNEARDDFWIAFGNCNNLADETARLQCRAVAKTDLADARGECREQFAARQELCGALGQAPYDPPINPANFLSPLMTALTPNPYLPLVPGTQWVYESEDETITVTVTDETKEILGITAIVVRDVVEEDGQVVEDTDDWFAQDMQGNVWYLGEISREFEDGELVGIEGSWEAGVDGAKPGIVMLAAPAVGDVYRQEFALGDAEDAGEVLSITGTETTPGGSCSNTCVVTRDFTPLEPDHEENKYYAPGVGLILEVNPESGERTELQSKTIVIP